jgi:hypothetical protein
MASVITKHRSGRQISTDTTTDIEPRQIGGITADQLSHVHRHYAGHDEDTASNFYWAHNSVTNEYLALTHEQYHQHLPKENQ